MKLKIKEEVLSNIYGLGNIVVVDEFNFNVEYKYFGENMIIKYNSNDLINDREILLFDFSYKDVITNLFVKNRLFFNYFNFSYEENIYFPLTDIIDNDEIDENTILLNNGKKIFFDILVKLGCNNKISHSLITLLLQLDKVNYLADIEDGDIINLKRESEELSLDISKLLE